VNSPVKNESGINTDIKEEEEDWTLQSCESSPFRNKYNKDSDSS